MKLPTGRNAMLFVVVVVPEERTVDGVHEEPEPTQSLIWIVSPVPDVVPVAVSAAPCVIEFPGEKVRVAVGGALTQIEHEGITPFGG